MRYALCTALLCLAYPAPSFAAEMYLYGISDDVLVIVDLDEVVTTPDGLKMAWLTTLTKNAAGPSFPTARLFKTIQKIDCKQLRYQLFHSTAYTADDRFVAGWMPDPSDWDAILTGTIEDETRALVCEGYTSDSEAAPVAPNITLREFIAALFDRWD